MSLIKNLIKEQDNQLRENGNEAASVRPVKTAIDLQRKKLEKLMKNPEKPVLIAESSKDKDNFTLNCPTFVRNVMGSSAGAGSGEFHVYRHLRRKEYARQKQIQAKSAREVADDAYQQKLEENRRISEEKTAKKRAKRLKKKQRTKDIRSSLQKDLKPLSKDCNVSDNSEDKIYDTSSTSCNEAGNQKSI